MAKKDTQSQGETMTQDTVVEAVPVEVVANIVELSTGEKVNFGKNGKIISLYDSETSEITFKIADGSIVTFNTTDIPADVLAEATLYGLREKIKATLAPVPLVDINSKIQKEIENLKNGKFITRSSDTGSVELDTFMKAFALVNATGVVTTPEGGSFAVPTPFVSVGTALRPHWVNTSEVAVINEVLAYWDSLDRKEKAAQKRNTFVTTQASLLAV